MPNSDPSKKYVTTAQLRKRWGDCSHMFIERLLASDSDFPRPLKLGRRIRFYDVTAIEKYERSKIVTSAK